MRISIVVPVYNLAQYAAQCLTSILAQTEPDTPPTGPSSAGPDGDRSVEILVVDDESTDDTVARCQSVAARHPEIRILRNRHGGVSAARNTGIGAATGDYILFLDGDDFLSPGALAGVFSLLGAARPDTPPPDILFLSFTEYDDRTHRTTERPLRFDPDVIASGNGSAILAHLVARNELVVWNVCRHLFRRAFLLEHSLRFDPTLGCAEDCAFFLEAVPAGRAFAASDLSVYHYRQHRAGSLITTMSPKSLRDKLFTSIRWIGRLQANAPGDVRRDGPILDSLARQLIDAIPTVLALDAGRHGEAWRLLRDNRGMLRHATGWRMRLKRLVYRILGFTAGQVVLDAYAGLAQGFRRG